MKEVLQLFQQYLVVASDRQSLGRKKYTQLQNQPFFEKNSNVDWPKAGARGEKKIYKILMYIETQIWHYYDFWGKKMNALKFDFLFSCQTVPLAQSNKSSRQRNIWTQILSRWYQVSLQRLSLWEPQIKEGIQQENNRHIACITYCLVFRHIMEQEIYLYKRNNLSTTSSTIVCSIV